MARMQKRASASDKGNVPIAKRGTCRNDKFTRLPENKNARSSGRWHQLFNMSLKVLTLCAVLAIAAANVVPEVPYHVVPLDVEEVPEIAYPHEVPLVDGTPDDPDEVQMPKYHFHLEEEVEEKLKDVEHPYVPGMPEVPHVPSYSHVPDVHDVPNIPKEHEEEVHSHVEKLKKVGQIWAHTVMTHKDTYFPNP